jgi:hypothetical protein
MERPHDARLTIARAAELASRGQHSLLLDGRLK